jgi:Tfp pilus assembly protein PilF
MMRLGVLALAIFLSMPAALASAELHEESIPAQDLAAPASPAAQESPAAAPSPAGDAIPDTDSDEEDWETVHPGKSPPAEREAPMAASTAVAPVAPSAPAEVAPAIDVGSIATTPQISDSPLTPLIDTAPTPARAASLRITEAQRVELERGHTENAVRELAHAISIDPSDSYAYFYLGRAYVARRDYGQAQTFFRRAQIGLASNSAWLGETYAFEGLSLEQEGKSAEAAAAYQKALAASPGNLTARVGVTRLSAFMPAAASAASAPTGDLDEPAPAQPEVAPPPNEAPAPPPPASRPPPTAN